MGFGKLFEWALVVRGLQKSLTLHEAAVGKYPIDFVVTWVDGSDPAWQKAKAGRLGLQYDENGNGIGRYRDWSTFRYWFRAVEAYAPWVRYVHLVTWGHVPAWLEQECPKLKIVRHEEFIPEEYLPTFNCNPIELNLFRIPNLSEHFVYFNDDQLLAHPVQPEDFFVNGKPVHTAAAIPYVNRDNEIPYHLFYNTYGVANKHNNVHDCIEKHLEKWFSWKLRPFWKYNLDAWRNWGLSSMYFTHMGAPFCKSSMAAAWDKYAKECDATCRYPLRDIHQITHQIFSIEDILNGNFEPSRPDWGQCILIDDIPAIRKAYESRTGKMICLFDRDNLSEEEVERIDGELTALFESIFPKRSAFELRS